MTNAEKIRSMTDDELAKLIGPGFDCQNCPARSAACTEYHEDDAVPECWELVLIWLKQEAEK